MSLDYDMTRIKDREVHFPPDEQGRMNDILHVLIWNSMAIDIGEITEANVDEVWFRTDVWQRLIGTQFNKWVPAPHPYSLVLNEDGSASVNMYDDDEPNGEWVPFELTYDDIVHAVGLRTNVPNSTRYQFIRKVMGRVDERHKSWARVRAADANRPTM
jgi:hypothetical protein